MRSLVTGAGGAIGKGLIATLAERGDVICISSRQPEGDNWYTTDYSPDSIKQVFAELSGSFDQVYICNGFLHDEEHTPEKRLTSLTAETLSHALEANLLTPTLLLQQLFRNLSPSDATRIAVLTARVGSIEDNQSGGWYSYRSSKAAMNMIIRTAAIELVRRCRQSHLIALHPGTTESPLSAPFLKAGRHQWVDPLTTAERLVAVVDQLGDDANGRFYDWRGDVLPW